MRRVALGVEAPQRCRQDLLAPQGEHVAAGRVVDRQARGEQAGREEHGHEVVRPRPDEPAVHVEDEGAEVVLPQVRGRLDPAAADDAPGRERVEDADDQHRGVRRPGDAPLRVVRLLAVEGRRLEADERGEREHQREPQRTREHRRRGEHHPRQGRRPLVRDDPAVEQQQDQDLGGHQHGQDLGADVDGPVAEERRERPADRGDQQPGDVVDAGAVEDHRAEVAERPHEPGGQRVVRHHRDERDGHRRRPAEPPGDVRVERPGVDDLAAHRRVADGEAEQDHGREDERAGQARPVAELERERDVAHHRRQGRRCGYDQEDDPCGRELPAVHLPIVVDSSELVRRNAHVHPVDRRATALASAWLPSPPRPAAWRLR